MLFKGLPNSPNATVLVRTLRWTKYADQKKLVRIGAKVVSHARYVIFQMAEVAVPKRRSRAILERIRRLRPPETAPR
jgi:hypothetical protein